jgi:hypothetical protein
MEITKEQFDGWKASQITREVFEELEKRREEIKEDIATGFYVNPESASATAMQNIRAMGMIDGIDLLFKIEWSDSEGAI